MDNGDDWPGTDGNYGGAINGGVDHPHNQNTRKWDNRRKDKISRGKYRNNKLQNCKTMKNNSDMYTCWLCIHYQ